MQPSNSNGFFPVTTFVRAGKSRRRAAEHLGRTAEDEVASRLRDQGFEILAMRLKTGSGEIDLIAADAQRLLFIEVKARPSFAEAAYTISSRQQARLVQAASIALARNPEWERPDIRFDAALVAGGVVQFIEDAIRLN